MADARRPPEVGQHLLGPHVVGQRVVVRRVLRGETGPTGGPALTDVLGVCVAWADGVCVVQPESGAAVAIRIGDIVSGKPVPPRPSVRHRVSVREAEAHTAALWPGIERVALGEWELRSDPAPTDRLFKRANSCLAMGDPGVPFDDAVAAVGSFYAERGRDPLVQVEAESSVEEAFARAGWQVLPHGEAEHRLAPLSRVRRSLAGVAEPAGIVVDEQGPRVRAALGEVAQGRAAIDGDWLGLHGVQVAEPQRRQGLGRGVVAALLEWGAEQGATTAWLHVETDNRPAVEFWDRLGFAPHHTCRYYAPASASSGPPVSR